MALAFDGGGRAGSPADVSPPQVSASPPESRGPPSDPRPSVVHVRGRLDPPLPRDAPFARRLIRGAKRLGHGLVVHDAFGAAPAMAFHFFLSLMPLLVFIGYVVGVLVRRRGAHAVLAPFLDNLPDISEQVIKHELERLAGASALGPIAAFGFLWLASGGVHGLMNALETVTGAPRRPWWKKRVIGAAWTVGAVATIVGASLLLVEWDALVHPYADVAPTSGPALAPSTTNAASRGAGRSGASAQPASSASAQPASSASAKRAGPARRRWRILRSGFERVLAVGSSLALACAGLAAFYRYSVSHPRRVKRRVWSGAVVAVGLWMAISWGFGLYARTLATYAVYYGSLTAVAVTLIWLWLTSLAILVGAELNAQLEGLRD
jgi:uncharacterized BrkB/YihY/UPF0761 family membrane protein